MFLEQDRVVVQLTINPIMLYVGSGSTLQSAQEAAAFAALVYMKLMLQEWLITKTAIILYL